MKTDKDKFYVIRHKPTGLMKAGGQNANFNKTGKLWLGARIKMHLRQFDNYYNSARLGLTLIQSIEQIWNGPHTNFPVDECEVIELELKETNSQPLREFIEKEMK